VVVDAGQDPVVESAISEAVLHTERLAFRQCCTRRVGLAYGLATDSQLTFFNALGSHVELDHVPIRENAFEPDGLSIENPLPPDARRLDLLDELLVNDLCQITYRRAA